MDSTTSPNARKKRMEQLVLVDLKGKIDVETGKQIEGDHVDALQGKMPITVVLSAAILMKIQKVARNGVWLPTTRWEPCRARLPAPTLPSICSSGRIWVIPAGKILSARHFINNIRNMNGNRNI